MRRPRLGFLGLGWIGRARLQALLAADAIEAAALADPSAASLAAAAALARDARLCGGLDDLLALDLDGIVIATPSAQHAEQAIRALQRGVAVFCQKPLGRTACETKSVIDAARAADRRLGVDLSYRFTAGMRAIRELVTSQALGRIYAADLVFHNAYGPDKDWFYDPAQSGGGCVIDLGVHLVDLALWTLDFPAVRRVSANLFAAGEPLRDRAMVEDYAIGTIELADHAVIRITCSWRLHAGCDAEISAAFHGTGGGATWRNVRGSFYEFIAHQYHLASAESIAGAGDDWGGRAALHWAHRLAYSRSFDVEAARILATADVLDLMYGRKQEGLI